MTTRYFRLCQKALILVWIGLAPAYGLAQTAPSTSLPENDIEPAGAPTLRRDPLELPLTEQEWMKEWLLMVTLNGAVSDDIFLFIEHKETKRFFVERRALDAWRLLFDTNALMRFQGRSFFPLDRIPGLESRLDETALEIELTIPAHLFETTEFILSDKPSVEPAAEIGGFVDYDIVATTGESDSDQIDGLLEFGGFSPLGTGLMNFSMEDVTDDANVTRLETMFFRDFPELRSSLRIGDSFTKSGNFATGVRFAGFQYATNFATDPTFVTFPLPSIGGLIKQQSVVEVLFDNISQSSSDVPPGPFSIPNVPVVTGTGEVQLKITDLLGREQLITQEYHVSARLLKAGLHDFSYAAGAIRRKYGQKSTDYGDLLITGSHRYGVTDTTTIEFHGESQPDRSSVIAGGTLQMGRYGTITSGVGTSFERSGTPGQMAQIAYEWRRKAYSFGARTRYTNRSFRLLGENNHSRRRVDQINGSINLGKAGRLGLFFAQRSFRDSADSRSYSASYNIPYGKGALTFNAAQTIDPRSDFIFTGTYTIPLGPSSHISGEMRRSSKKNDYRLNYRRGRPASDLGIDYRIGLESTDQGYDADARFDYGTRVADFRLEAETVDGNSNMRGEIGGSLTFLNSDITATRRIGRAFGLVDLEGVSDVGVYLDNRFVGQTDDDGRLVLTDLRPYENNRVHIDPKDLPMNARLTIDNTIAVPYARSGVLIDLDVHLERNATANLLDKNGKPLPGGLSLTDATGTIEALVGRNGFAEFTNLPDTDKIELLGTDGRLLYRCTIPLKQNDDDPLPHVGDVRCQS